MIRKYVLPLLAIVGLAIAVAMVISGNRAAAPTAQTVVQSANAPFTSYIFGPGIVEASTENIAIGTASLRHRDGRLCEVGRPGEKWNPAIQGRHPRSRGPTPSGERQSQGGGSPVIAGERQSQRGGSPVIAGQCESPRGGGSPGKGRESA